MTGLTCAGTWVTGTGSDGARREVYLHHVVDNAWSMAEYGSQAVVWQTAVNPVVALELIDSGAWAGAGVLGKREAEVARLVADGLTNKQIGARLFVSERTVDSHVRSILNKLGFSSRAQIAAWMGPSDQ